jgi:hypothetical protein
MTFLNYATRASPAPGLRYGALEGMRTETQRATQHATPTQPSQNEKFSETHREGDYRAITFSTLLTDDRSCESPSHKYQRRNTIRLYTDMFLRAPS